MNLSVMMRSSIPFLYTVILSTSLDLLALDTSFTIPTSLPSESYTSISRYWVIGITVNTAPSSVSDPIYELPT